MENGDMGYSNMPIFRAGDQAKRETDMKQAASRVIQVSYFACFSPLKMEILIFSQMSVGFKRTKRRYVPELLL
jgi:hypothetical protein